MRCPNKDIDCPYVDTAGMSKLKECSVCEYNTKERGMAIGKENTNEEARVAPFESVETLRAKRAFRHLSDHLLHDPCGDCVDRDTRYCVKECLSRNKRHGDE